jgi:effector-binding domain-containing protein
MRELMAGMKLEKRKQTDIAFISHVGPHDKVPWGEYIEKLYGWAKSNKVMPGFYPMAIYPDDPRKTPPDKVRTEIALPFKGKARPTAEIKVKRLPEMRVATISHKGPGSEYVNTYAKLTRWVEEKGLEVTGPPIEIFSKKPEVINGVQILHSKVIMPVAKK